MRGISSTGKERIKELVDSLFDRLSAKLFGRIPALKHKKELFFSANDLTLASIFLLALGNRRPNSIEEDALKGLLLSSFGYFESLKHNTSTNITEQVDSLIKESYNKGELVDDIQVQKIVEEQFKKASNSIKMVAESQATKIRNVGSILDISRVAAEKGIEDPTVFFNVIRDRFTCEWCVKNHLHDNGTPKTFKLSEIKQGFLSTEQKKSGEVSACGLHPNCFTEEMRLHTSDGLITLKDLFLSQKEIEVFVDKRVKNRKIGNNQYGIEIPGAVWLDRHSSGTKKLQATSVYETGVQECFKITLENGLELEVSNGHEMWVDDNKSGIKIKASELKIGDKIPTISGECGFGKDSFPELSELMGNLMGDGYLGKKSVHWNFFGNDIPYGEKLYKLISLLDKNWKCAWTIREPNEKYSVSSVRISNYYLKRIFTEEFGLTKKPRRVPVRLFSATKETVAAFLRGLYAADGCVQENSIAISQNDKEFLKEIQLLLSNFGLVTSLYRHDEECQKTITYANGDQFLTNRKPTWRLLLGGWERMAVFYKEIGMGVPVKQEKLLCLLRDKEGKDKHGGWRTSKVQSIEPIGLKQTYCLTEPMTNTVTVNGIVTGQCRCTVSFLSPGYGFKRGKLEYIHQNHDEYNKQKS